MSTSINYPYFRVCEALLESGGLQLGIVTQQEFLTVCYTVIQDFLQKTGLNKKIICILQQPGQGPVTMPDWAGEPEAVFAGELALVEGDQGQQDATIPG